MLFTIFQTLLVDLNTEKSLSISRIHSLSIRFHRSDKNDHPGHSFFDIRFSIIGTFSKQLMFDVFIRRNDRICHTIIINNNEFSCM